MGLDLWVQAVESFGFPIAIASFILFRLDKSIQRLEETVFDLIEEEKESGK
ncbi:YvrJ family protein [Halobacillus sp. A5]|uniref:YvrJ family protein n=1 Tax=Halobacillus sp. A5 TaxID=2880263 RepID=UPI0020A63C0F|nr:YvrJ family protein [Halobacillus sp. A5]MCP3029162.1 YvrJ family protein [Halobacillus sp. A5]